MTFPDKVAYQPIDESEKRIREIGHSIVEGKESLEKVSGKSKVMNFLGKVEQPAARLFGLELHANNECTSCGTCWENCPEKAISLRFSKFIPISQGYDLKKFRPTVKLDS